MFNMTLLGLGVALVAIVSGQLVEGTNLALLLQPTALLVVCGGTLGATIAQSSAADMRHAMAMLRWVVHTPVDPPDAYVREIVGWARLVHKDSVLKLDALSASIEDPWLKNGVEMVVDQLDAHYIRETLRMELQVRDARARRAIRVWESAAGYAPTIGIIGSVLGLLRVMSTMQDASTVGSGLAIAFVATLYGLSLANLVFLPLANRLKATLYERTLRDEMRIEGLIMIAQNKNPRLVEKTLASFSVQPPANVTVLRKAA